MGDMSLVDLGKRLLETAKLGQTDEVRHLMTNGAPFTTDWLGVSPLHMAAQHGHVETAEVLLRGGISRDARTKVDRTPLHIASQEGHLELVKLLISHGAEVDARDMLKMTPLHWAVERCHLHVAKVLVKNGADVCAQSKFDKTPLDIAEDNQHILMMELLSNHISESKTVKQYHRSATSNASQENPKVPFFSKLLSTSTNLRTLSQTVQASPLITVTSPTTYSGIPGITVRSANVSKPMLLRTSLASLQKAAATSSSIPTACSDSEGESNDQQCTNVLATLAALAEATAPNASISTSDALHWLGLNGIAMLPTDNSTIVASALEDGQTVSLTEAGKLALTWVKEQQNLNNASNAKSKSQQTSVTTANAANLGKKQKVITIMADKSHVPSIVSSSQTPIVVLSSPSLSSNAPSPPFKKMRRTLSPKVETENALANGNTSTSTKSDEEERLKLKEELEKIKKQAELYKSQLMEKEHEAEEYKKQLEQMRTLPSD